MSGPPAKESLEYMILLSLMEVGAKYRDNKAYLHSQLHILFQNKQPAIILLMFLLCTPINHSWAYTFCWFQRRGFWFFFFFFFLPYLHSSSFWMLPRSPEWTWGCLSTTPQLSISSPRATHTTPTSLVRLSLRKTKLLWRSCPLHSLLKKLLGGASLVAQWLRICLPMQGTRVRALVWEDPTCHGATGPVSHNY